MAVCRIAGNVLLIQKDKTKPNENPWKNNKTDSTRYILLNVFWNVFLGWTWIEHFVFMASALATPATSSSKETTNYARLCRVLVDVGTCALRDSFDAICTPPTLHTFLAANQPTLQSLRSRRIINATQWGKLFPAISASVSSRDFDITLLMILLRNVCGLAPPLTGWDSLPAATDFSHEADIARIKYLRNTVYAHAEHASVDDATFAKHWKDIRDTLVRLGGVTYEVKDF